jgi:HSP20 family protein
MATFRGGQTTMSIVMRWNPVHTIFELNDMISQRLEWTAEMLPDERKLEKGSAWVPAADMYETDAAIIIQMELAGIEKDSLEILFQEEYLFLRGNRPLNSRMRSAKIHRLECLYGKFQRVFRIPHPVEARKISTIYEQGVLKIVLPKVNTASFDRVNIPISKE